MITVVIPTRNRAAVLAGALEALQRQSLGSDLFEVIVVDNGSTDDTARLCERAQGWFPNYHYVFEPRPGLHVGRHLGMKLARGDILVYADDDARGEPTWLAAVEDAFLQDDVALVGGKCIPDYEGEEPPWLEELWNPILGGRINVFYSLVELGDVAKDIPPEYVFGCNFSIRKAVLEKAGGFHPDGMPKRLRRYRGDGETAVSRSVTAMGLRARYVPDAAVRHIVSRDRLTLAYVYDRAFLQGISDSYTAIRREFPSGTEVFLSAAGHAIVGRMPLRSLAGRSPCWQARFRGYHNGFAWHRGQLLTTRELRAWVAKSSYID